MALELLLLRHALVSLLVRLLVVHARVTCTWTG